MNASKGSGAHFLLCHSLHILLVQCARGIGAIDGGEEELQQWLAASKDWASWYKGHKQQVDLPPPTLRNRSRRGLVTSHGCRQCVFELLELQ